MEQNREIAGPKIVYAEDSPVVQKIAVKALHDAGFAVVETFTTGRQALDYVLQTTPGEISLILSDIEMPEMDGISFCKALREHSETASIPFVFFSSIMDEEIRQRCEAVGANRSFSKPELDEVVAAIVELLGRPG